jgi:hypothetical protein
MFRYQDAQRWKKLLTPVPNGVHSCVRVIHSDIADSELLISNRHAILATVEYNV